MCLKCCEHVNQGLLHVCSVVPGDIWRAVLHASCDLRARFAHIHKATRFFCDLCMCLIWDSVESSSCCALVCLRLNVLESVAQRGGVLDFCWPLMYACSQPRCVQLLRRRFRTQGGTELATHPSLAMLPFLQVDRRQRPHIRTRRLQALTDRDQATALKLDTIMRAHPNMGRHMALRAHLAVPLGQDTVNAVTERF